MSATKNLMILGRDDGNEFDGYSDEYFRVAMSCNELEETGKHKSIFNRPGGFGKGRRKMLDILYKFTLRIINRRKTKS